MSSGCDVGLVPLQPLTLPQRGGRIPRATAPGCPPQAGPSAHSSALLCGSSLVPSGHWFLLCGLGGDVEAPEEAVVKLGLQPPARPEPGSGGGQGSSAPGAGPWTFVKRRTARQSRTARRKRSLAQPQVRHPGEAGAVGQQPGRSPAQQLRVAAGQAGPAQHGQLHSGATVSGRARQPACWGESRREEARLGSRSGSRAPHWPAGALLLSELGCHGLLFLGFSDTLQGTKGPALPSCPGKE
ncbi:hypothetical protein AAY473_003015 [Plecturocebus cupreus]